MREDEGGKTLTNPFSLFLDALYNCGYETLYWPEDKIVSQMKPTLGTDNCSRTSMARMLQGRESGAYTSFVRTQYYSPFSSGILQNIENNFLF